jgi:hypothetical protein
MKDLGHFTPRYAGEPTHDKTYDVAHELGVHPLHAYGLISAFRARYPVEAPEGRLRGGAAQIERLALWDGEPGKLTRAFVSARIVDLIQGTYCAHEHDLYAGETHKKRKEARERKRKQREATADAIIDQLCDGHSADVCDSHTGTTGGKSLSPLLSSTSPDPGAEKPTEHPPEKINRGRLNPGSPPPRHGRIGYGGVGFMENPVDFPKTPEEIVDRHADDFALRQGAHG